jgi:hypothetical protein
MMPGWNHEKTFLALLDQQKAELGDLKSSNIYIRVYPQKQNCAILYSPNATKAFRENPLHFKGPDYLRETAREDWDHELFEQLNRFIKLDHRDKNQFDWYGISDWNGFATALKLELS